jgi:hypothetical protein
MANANMIDRDSILGLAINLNGPLELTDHSLGSVKSAIPIHFTEEEQARAMSYLGGSNAQQETTKDGWPPILDGGVMDGLPIIDGRTLTENEVAFEEHCAEHFDLARWMKKARIDMGTR